MDPWRDEDVAGEQNPFPNTIERRRTSLAQSDNMAEHGSARSNGPESVSADVDTCRICRGEATSTEPLFYPCKCSGSIKYVHQDCLMEWLSHSQKKHCELCKTPFRFTKLYSPHMPQQLPPYVFVSHMAKFLLRNILVWMRAALVTSVWLGWLPYLMRSAWSLLFWISDEGFGPHMPSLFDDGVISAAYRKYMDAFLAQQGAGSDICPSSPLFPIITSTALNTTMDEIVQGSSRVLSETGSNITNATSGNAMISFITRTLFGGFTFPSFSTDMALYQPHTVKLPGSTPQHPSLLSEISILKNLTRHPGINRMVIAVLEGQIITLLVIVCFILIILVRDYVVQQQPEINMRAAFAAQANNVDAPPADVPDGADLRGPDPDSDTDTDFDWAAADEDSTTAQIDDGNEDRALPPADENANTVEPDAPERPVAGFRRRLTHRGTQEEIADPSASGSNVLASPEYGRMQGMSPEAYAGAVDESKAALDLYFEIYQRAGGNHATAVRIIKEEGLEERLAYWMDLGPESAKGGHENPFAMPQDEQGLEKGTEDQPSVHPVDNGMPAGEAGDRKGKGRVGEEPSNGFAGAESAGQDQNTMSVAHWSPPHPRDPLDNAASAASSSNIDWVNTGPRPRAVSDGPRRRESVNPLANNSWSFSNSHHTDGAAQTGPEASGEGSSNHMTHTEPSFTAVPDRGEPANEVDGNNDIGNAVVAHDQGTQRLDRGEAHAPEAYVDHIQNATAGIEMARPRGPVNAPLPAAQRPAGLVERVMNFMWGPAEEEVPAGAMPPGVLEPFGEDDLDEDDEESDEEDEDGDDIDDEADDDNAAGMDADVVEAAVAAGLDPEAMEDVEDFDGIMELIGMRGPITGLFQNAIFCALLVSMSIFVGIFIPYNIGRVTVWVLANPMRILRIVFSFSKFVQDLVLFAVGLTLRAFLGPTKLALELLGMDSRAETLKNALVEAKSLMSLSLSRTLEGFVTDILFFHKDEVRNFSAISHESLIFVKGQIRGLLCLVGDVFDFSFGGDYATKWTMARSVTSSLAPQVWESLKNISTSAMQPSSWVIDLSLPQTNSTVDPALAYWSGNDRTLAIFSGFTSVSVLAGLYLSRGVPFTSTPTAQEWEANVMDALNQASGVMKVILIISIEMLVFPLYCGLLLDFALLPLFEGVSLKSRFLFTYNYPLTSIFVHWFVGTGYMFHFALFVSMCRKIMRKGVLYFIKDPDDPEFHPVRDVLERTVTTQLRKILFSAFVYGALVVVCLGGVVWGLSLALPQVLPIHYSSNEPVLEFPIDLLFYNFCMPLAVKVFKPSEGLSAMYAWWFRRCARALRLTWFLFGERWADEEGRLAIQPGSEASRAPWYRKLFLEVRNDKDGKWRVEPSSLSAVLEGDTYHTSDKKPRTRTPGIGMEMVAKMHLEASGEIIPDGRFVLTPASDQVKIPKGEAVFKTVDEKELYLRRDDPAFRPDKHFHIVYIPPHFRFRIFLFILFIWLFAAVTGVSFTIVPLVFGRRVFKALIPAHIQTNDIYAFSIGLYALGSMAYAGYHAKPLVSRFRAWLAAGADRLPRLDGAAVLRVAAVGRRVLKCAYAYAMLLALFPLLATVLMDLYVLMPLHTWSSLSSADPREAAGAAGAAGGGGGPRATHTIRVVQSWTLGLLYVKLGARALLLYGGRAARATRAVLYHGWLDPDVRVLTRAFVLPGALACALLVLGPPLWAGASVRLGFLAMPAAGGAGDDNAKAWLVVVYRLSYPVAAAAALQLLVARRALQVVVGWKARVRDEAYLIGERLHNFQTVTMAAAGAVPVPGRGGWHGGGGGVERRAGAARV